MRRLLVTAILLMSGRTPWQATHITMLGPQAIAGFCTRPYDRRLGTSVFEQCRQAIHFPQA